MSEAKGAISSNDLMMKLVNAKKVMNKVDSGNYSKGNIDESIIGSDPEELMRSQSPKTETQQSRSVQAPINEDKINSSKLPDAIKRAMIENPIPQISLNDSLDMDFIEGAKKLMVKEGLASKQPNQPTQQRTNVTPNQFNGDIAAIIRETIKDTLEEIVDRKLELILNASKTASINENLVLKVGDSIFRGKITGVNKAK
jgi:hypothetical protein